MKKNIFLNSIYMTFTYGSNVQDLFTIKSDNNQIVKKQIANFPISLIITTQKIETVWFKLVPINISELY